jgi:hypothetical protein
VLSDLNEVEPICALVVFLCIFLVGFLFHLTVTTWRRSKLLFKLLLSGITFRQLATAFVLGFISMVLFIEYLWL